MDSSALSLIVAEQRRARLENFRFVVATGGTRAVTRLLELSGLMETLEVVEDPGAVAQ
jgi:anti-anti-sigma regulatory factor